MSQQPKEDDEEVLKRLQELLEDLKTIEGIAQDDPSAARNLWKIVRAQSPIATETVELKATATSESPSLLRRSLPALPSRDMPISPSKPSTEDDLALLQMAKQRFDGLHERQRNRQHDIKMTISNWPSALLSLLEDGNPINEHVRLSVSEIEKKIAETITAKTQMESDCQRWEMMIKRFESELFDGSLSDASGHLRTCFTDFDDRLSELQLQHNLQRNALQQQIRVAADKVKENESIILAVQRPKLLLLHKYIGAAASDVHQTRAQEEAADFAQLSPRERLLRWNELEIVKREKIAQLRDLVALKNVRAAEAKKLDDRIKERVKVKEAELKELQDRAWKRFERVRGAINTAQKFDSNAPPSIVGGKSRATASNDPKRLALNLSLSSANLLLSDTTSSVAGDREEDIRRRLATERRLLEGEMVSLVRLEADSRVVLHSIATESFKVLQCAFDFERLKMIERGKERNGSILFTDQGQPIINTSPRMQSSSVERGRLRQLQALRRHDARGSPAKAVKTRKEVKKQATEEKATPGTTASVGQQQASETYPAPEGDAHAKENGPLPSTPQQPAASPLESGNRAPSPPPPASATSPTRTPRSTHASSPPRSPALKRKQRLDEPSVQTYPGEDHVKPNSVQNENVEL